MAVVTCSPVLCCLSAPLSAVTPLMLRQVGRPRPAGFFTGWAMRGSEGRNPQAVSRGRGPVGSGAKHGDIFSKWCIYFVYWDFRQHFQHKKHFTTFPEGKKCSVPLPMLGAPMQTTPRNSKEKCRRYVIRYGRQACQKRLHSRYTITPDHQWRRVLSGEVVRAACWPLPQRSAPRGSTISATRPVHSRRCLPYPYGPYPTCAADFYPILHWDGWLSLSHT